MGTLTTNYDLYKPAFGEQGYDDEVNGNFDTIDAKLKELEDGLGTGAGHIIQQDGVDLPTEDKLNFIGFTVTDNPGNSSTDITMSGYFAPLTDGEEDDPHIVFVDGQVVMVWMDL